MVPTAAQGIQVAQANPSKRARAIGKWTKMMQAD